jgi:hypothetical protein
VKKDFINYINTTLSFTEEWELVFGHPPSPGNVFCPFHVNSETPAAKIYENRLHCFACNRNYTVYNLLSKFGPDRLKELASSTLIGSSNRDDKQRSIKPVLNDGILINVLRRIVNRI